eukprot:CAMPEP_0172719792 /NCGR_PEP_ID=MMETSP1074-20121228/75710_1 /TAXON_ID=2916 /ORGANISM="Ceratium fusus, Strain PA161109" /LENGTH=302 /DNA_ID=CAMNT_0013545183 /DNA_START=121 /DNA_END=1025 /DNA_ORIENTATION=-
MGQTIVIAYRVDGKGTVNRYEGVLADRRIGGTDRESYLELKKCLQLGPSNEILAREGNKKFIDAFIDDMAVTEARPDEPPPSEVEMATAMQNQMAMGMTPMGMGTGMMPMAMNMMPMGMGMGMMPMGMMSMGMPMAAMGMMPGMAAMQMAAMQSAQAGNSAGFGAGGGATSSTATSSIMDLRFGEEPKSSPEELAAAIERIDLHKSVRVAYMHPQLGKTTYQGVLREKFAGASALQSYIRLGDCERIGRSGKVREREEDKRLMTAFIDEITCIKSEAAPTSHSSHSRSRERNPRSLNHSDTA